MKRIFYIKREKEYDAGQLVLSLRVSEKYIGFSISNSNTDELMQLCWMAGEELNEGHIDELYHTYPELKKKYNKTVIGFDTPTAVLVPDKLYQQKYSSVFMHTLYSEQGCEAVVTEPVAKWQLHTIYSISESLQQKLKEYFTGAITHHAYAIGINQLKDLDSAGNLFIDFRSEDFSVLVTKGSSVMLFQTFTYASPADVVYYLLKICREFMIDPNTVNVEISGLLEKKSAMYVEIYWYFMNVRFREAQWQMPADTEQEYPSHFFTFFNDLSLCES